MVSCTMWGGCSEHLSLPSKMCIWPSSSPCSVWDYLGLAQDSPFRFVSWQPHESWTTYDPHWQVMQWNRNRSVAGAEDLTSSLLVFQVVCVRLALIWSHGFTTQQCLELIVHFSSTAFGLVLAAEWGQLKPSKWEKLCFKSALCSQLKH